MVLHTSLRYAIQIILALKFLTTRIATVFETDIGCSIMFQHKEICVNVFTKQNGDVDMKYNYGTIPYFLKMRIHILNKNLR